MAETFGIKKSTVHKWRKKLGLTRKKAKVRSGFGLALNKALPRQNNLQRIRRKLKKKFLVELEELKTEYGEENIYYQDKSGFDEYYTRR